MPRRQRTPPKGVDKALDDQPLLDALNPGLHGGVRITRQTSGNTGRDTYLTGDTRQSDTLHDGCAMPIPAAPKLEHGQMLVLWRLEAFLV